MLNFIRNFNKIKPSNIAKNYDIDYSNLISGRLSHEKEKIIYDELYKRILGLLINDTLDENQKNAIDNLKSLVEGDTEKENCYTLYTISQNEINSIYILLELLGVYLYE